MAQPQVIEGTWREVRKQTERLAREHPDERVRLVISAAAPERTPAEPPVNPEHFYWRATPEEFDRALQAIAGSGRRSPVLPPEAFERESIYDDRW